MEIASRFDRKVKDGKFFSTFVHIVELWQPKVSMSVAELLAKATQKKKSSFWLTVPVESRSIMVV